MATDDQREVPLPLEDAFRALAAIVRDEYADKYSLAYIASTWGSGLVPKEQVAALRFWERELLGETRDDPSAPPE